MRGTLGLQLIGSGRLWTPLRDPNVPYAFFPSLGRTDVAAAITSQDLTTWAKNPAGLTVTSTTVTEANGGAAAFQGVYQAAGLQAKHNCSISFLAKSTAGPGTVAWIGDNNSYWFAIDLADGSQAVPSGSGTITVGAPDGNGRRLIQITTTMATGIGQAFIVLAVGNNKVSPTVVGDNASTIEFTSISVTQVNVSAWASQKQTAALTQATAANRPYVATVADVRGNLQTALYFDGVNDYLTTLIAGLAQPVTVFVWAKYAAAWAAVDAIIDGGAAAQLLTYRTSDTSMTLNAGTAMAKTVSATTSFHSWALVANGASSSIWEDAVQCGTVGNAGAAAITGLTVGARANAGAFANAYIFAVAIYKGAANAATIQRANTFGRSRGFNP